jgi:hypothetical protein
MGKSRVIVKLTNSLVSANFADVGYSRSVYIGKDQQKTKVIGIIISKGFLPQELVDNEVSWFYG